ncbi:choice-of-anchor P family protein [Amycolatopsis sp. NPDC051102]|uniref:choice-of-anchor P family protein n=1 Tax=Amycolatopsis sp. NPDC051102 TaxID=3155163 RepID=UPI00343D60CA
MLAVTTLAVPVLGAAAPVTSTGWAASGSVDVTIDNEHVVTGDLAKCTADGPYRGFTQGGATGDIAVFGSGDSGCGRSEDSSIAMASGRRFRATVLQRYGGPVLTVRTYSVKCSTTATGSLGEVTVGAVEGVTVPEQIPPNHRIVIPGGAAGTALATVTLNETVTPQPPDGSLVTHAVHIKLFPQGGPASGDIYLGTAACDPFGKKQQGTFS